MLDKPTSHQERLHGKGHLAGYGATPDKKEPEPDAGEASCHAFGYLRGIRERADAIEFRLRDGNSVWFTVALGVPQPHSVRNFQRIHRLST